MYALQENSIHHDRPKGEFSFLFLQLTFFKKLFFPILFFFEFVQKCDRELSFECSKENIPINFFSSCVIVLSYCFTFHPIIAIQFDLFLRQWVTSLLFIFIELQELFNCKEEEYVQEGFLSVLLAVCIVQEALK